MNSASNGIISLTHDQNVRLLPAVFEVEQGTLIYHLRPSPPSVLSVVITCILPMMKISITELHSSGRSYYFSV